MIPFEFFTVDEHALVGQHEPGFRKYRVEFIAPRSIKDQRTGQFMDDTVYVIANNGHSAKRLAHDWIAGRFEPRENDPSPARKKNYLKDIEKKHLDIKSKVVGSWREVIDMLSYAATRRENIVDFIDEPELQIIADTLSTKSRDRYLNSLTEPQRQGLRKVLKASRLHPQQWSGPDGRRAQELATQIDHLIRLTRLKDDPTEIRTKNPYLDKLTPKEVDKILGRISSYPDVIREAARFGIPKQELDSFVRDKFQWEDINFDERKRLYQDMRKRLGIRSTHIAMQSDPRSKLFHNRFEWDRYANEVLPTMGFQTIVIPGQNSTDDYDGQANYENQAISWLWDFYAQGPPKSTPATQRYKDAFEEILNGYTNDKSKFDNSKVPF